MENRGKRQQMIENSRQKFYDNLSQHYKENKDMPILEATKEKKSQLPKAVAKKKEESKKEVIQERKAWGAPANKNRPTSQSRAKDTQNKDLNLETSKPTSKPLQSTLPKKSAPEFQPPSNANIQKRDTQISTVTASIKPPLHARDRLLEEVKEHIHNPKKLQEIKNNNIHVKVDFNQLIHQAKVQLLKENQSKASNPTMVDEISKRIETSKKLIEKLKQVSIPPPYATSILQSAIYNKSRVLEAHLSITNDDYRKRLVDEVDQYGRSAIFYSCFYGNLESVELLAAADGSLNLTDCRHRTALHYATMTDNPKIIEAVFLAFRQQGQEMNVSTIKSPPNALTGESEEKAANLNNLLSSAKSMGQSLARQSEAEPIPEQDEEGFEIEHEQDNNAMSFKVQDEGNNNESQKEGQGVGNMMSNFGQFFTKKAVLDVIDEKQATMYQEMDKLDTLYVQRDYEKPESFSFCVPQVSQKSLINWRDKHGRTPLHLAVAFNNKASVETLLFLNANPMIEDLYGQRPIDICIEDSIRDLLKIKMQRAEKPTLNEIIDPQKRRCLPPGSNLKGLMNKGGLSLQKVDSQMSTTSKTQKKRPTEQQMYPLDLKDLTLMPEDKLLLSKIGIENDNYLLYAFKNAHLDACIYLIRDLGGFDFQQKNSVGQTLLHMAVKTNQLKFAKLLFMKEIDQSLLDNPQIEDIQGNIRESTMKLLKLQNNKGATPLMLAIEQQNYKLFRFLLEMCHYSDQITKINKILPHIINLKNDKGETPLLMAVRTNQIEIVYSLLQIGDEVVTQEVLNTLDSQSRNILHYAVINQNKELIQRLVLFDSDKSELRNQQDCKKKVPQQYDPSSVFIECFSTVWDYAKEGNIRKMRMSIDQGKFGAEQGTYWLKNTPLHIAVRHQKLEVIKCLVFDYHVDIHQENLVGKSALKNAETIKDQPTKTTIIGLLNKLHSTTKVVRNLEQKKEREDQKKKNMEEVKKLREQLQEAVRSRGLDLKKMFELFDKNGDGVFQPMEFECAFTALDINFAKADLRRLIALTDTNKDGRIDINEFNALLEDKVDEGELEKIAEESIEIEDDVC